MHLQSKLLRVLESRCLERLGGRYSIPLDVRIIAATNSNLEQKVKEGSFREDLYFRINVIPLNIPPLRERKEDVTLLAQFFLQLYTGKFNKNISSIDEDVCYLIQAYPWPGNVRELSNAIEFAVNMEDSDSLSVESLPLSVKSYNVDVKGDSQNIDQMRTAILKKSLDKYGYGKKGKSQAAEIMGVSLATIYRWVKKYKLDEDDKQ